MQTTQTPPRKARRRSPPSRTPDTRGFTVRWRHPERTLPDFAAALWARRRLLLGLTLACTTAGLIHALRKPNTYTSSATVMVYGSSAVRSPTEGAANLFASSSSLAAQVATAVDVVASRVVLGRVAERIGHEEILTPYQAPSRRTPDQGLLDRAFDTLHSIQARWLAPEPPDFSRFSESELLAAAIETLERNLVVEPSALGATISLTYEHPSPEGAARILGAVVDESVRRYSDVVAPPEGKDWLDAEIREAADAETTARAAHEGFFREHGTTDLTAEITTLSKALGEMIGEHQVASMKLQEHQDVLPRLREEFQKPSAKASASHYLALEKSIQTREFELMGLRTQVPLLEQAVRDTQADLETARRLHREVQELAATLAIASDRHDRLVQSAKEYEVSNELDRRGLSNLRVVEPAAVPRIKSGPRRFAILIAAALGALGLGVTWVVVRERLNRRLMNQRDVMFSLGRSDVVSTPLLTEDNLKRFEEARRRGWE